MDATFPSRPFSPWSSPVLCPKQSPLIYSLWTNDTSDCDFTGKVGGVEGRTPLFMWLVQARSVGNTARGQQIPSSTPHPSSLDITSPRPLLLWWQRRQCLIHGSALTCSKLKLLDWMVCACKHRTLKNWNGCSRKHWTTLEAGDTLITSPVQGWQSTSFRNVFDLHCLIYRKWKLSHCFCRKTELEILSHCTDADFCLCKWPKTNITVLLTLCWFHYCNHFVHLQLQWRFRRH